MGNLQSQGLGINKDVKFNVNPDLPTTKINVRLHNGDTITQEFNLSHTVGDIYGFVQNVAPVQGSYSLVEGFPPKPLSDKNKTIDAAKLQGSLISQRLN